MKEGQPGFASVDEYISTFPAETQKILQELRATIKAAAPDAEERISYQMPAFYLKGNLVYFAAFKNHFSFFPTASGVEAFKDKLSAYAGSKGTVRFPADKPLPFDLISEIVKYRVNENLKKAEMKSKKKK